MPKYKKRSDGRYLRQFLIGYSDNGKPKYKNIFGRTITELEQKCTDYLALKNKGVIIDDANLTFGKWAQTWLETYKCNVKPSTKAMYKYVISKHFTEIENIRLMNLKATHIQNLLNSLSPRTQQKVLITIKQILNQAIENDYIYKNVAKNIKTSAHKAIMKRSLSDTEIAEILALQLPLMTRTFLAIILYCGLRRGETWALTKNNIDLKNKIITVNKSVTLLPKLSVTTPKTKASTRQIGIPEPLYDILVEYLPKCQLLLFHDKNNELISDYSLRKMWSEFLSEYNRSKGGTPIISAIPRDITPHIFRHTYATMLYHAGVDIKTAQYLLGHSTLEMTLKIYTHLEDKDKLVAIEKLNAFLDKTNTDSHKNITNA